MSVSGGLTGTRLDADPGSWSAEGEISYRYQWQRCDGEGAECEDVEGERASFYLPGEDDADSAFRVVVTAIVAGGNLPVTSAPTAALEATEPEATELPEVFHMEVSGDALEGRSGKWLGIGQVEFESRWLRCDALGEECEEVEGRQDGGYELGEEDVGSTLRFEVTATNDSGNTVAASEETEVIALPSNEAPVLVSPPSIGGDPALGEELTASVGVWSGAVSYRYQWMRCDPDGQECDPIVPTANEAGYETVSDDVGSTIGVVVTALAADGSRAHASALSAQTVRAVGAPANSEAPALSGLAEEGESLTASSGSWSGTGPIEYEYRWQRCGPDSCVDIAGATGNTYVLGADDVLQTVRAVVSAENGAGTTATVTAKSAPVDSKAPVLETAPMLSGEARKGKTLSATTGAWSGEAPISFDYRWQRCDPAGAACSAISGAEASSYELTGADVGAAVRVLVTATNLSGEGEASSEPTVPVAAAGGPSPKAAPTISGTARTGAELSAGDGEWEGAETFAYQWLRCEPGTGRAECAVIPGAEADEYGPGYDDVGSSLRVLVTATGPAGTAGAVSAGTAAVAQSVSPEVEAAALRKLAPASISGEAVEGESLSADPGEWSSPWAITYSYQWRRCDAAGAGCVNIEEANSPVLTLTGGDVGSTVRVAVTATVGPHSQTSIAKPTAVVAQAKPANLAPPSIFGEAREGSSLFAEVGEWSGSELFTYQWRRCDAEGGECADIEGAEAETYLPTFDDLGATLRVVVTGTNGAGSTPASSAATAVVAPSAPESLYDPEVFGEAFEDGLLEAAPGTWAGTPELEFTYQWQRCDELGEACADIEGATEPTYTADAEDVGSTLQVRVRATNEVGWAEATSSPSELIGPPLVPVFEGPPPTIEGFPYDGRELVAQPGGWSGHEPLEFSYEWQRCDAEGAGCEAIPGATGESYLTTGADLEGTIRVEVTATNTSGSDSETSATTEPLTSAAPLNVEAPALAGEGRVGVELEASAGQWSGSGPLEIAYQWQRCDVECEDIEAATESTYVPGVEDAREEVRVAVTATGPKGSKTDYSETLPILPEASENLSLPTVSGTAVVGETLTASAGEWSPEPDQYGYQWQRCSISGTGCSDLSGETEATYLLTVGDAGMTLRVVVSAENEGEAEPPSATSILTGVINTETPSNLAQPSLSTTTPVVGQKLTATTGTWIGVPTITYEYEWQ
ncbi:MAG TPA: hypothetical protein VFB52_10035, partial [Solirubrobacterales bacterium]|nr:hypothetical protein [Solirubrobacterales bacterium]